MAVRTSFFASRPVVRWTVPVVAAVAVAGGGAAVGTLAASAEPSLPPRTAAELLVDLRSARVEGLSGTVVQRADLGLPPLAGLLGSGGASALTTGANTFRLWYAGPDQVRIAHMGAAGENEMIRNGRDVWVWRSRTNEAVHYRLTESGADRVAPRRSPEHGDLPVTPQEAADQALAAIDKSTEVSVGRSATIAGRDAYELVLRPRDTASLLGQISIAVDAVERIPLRVEVLARDGGEPVFEVAFTQVDFARPHSEQFVFAPRPGAKVIEGSVLSHPGAPGGPDTDRSRTGPSGGQQKDDKRGVTTIGTGWATVWATRLPGQGGEPVGVSGSDRDESARFAALRQLLPEVSGEWGRGRLLSTRLAHVLVTDDGRVFAGLVTPERLYEVAAAG